MRTCPHCGCSEIDEDAARGDATCTGCGTVLEESIVVTENQFQERAGGSGHTLVGQFVSTERATGNALTGMGSVESREVTYQKGRKLIEEVGSQLRINQHCMDTAFNFFKMCVSRNLSKGRTRVSVVTSCLYMTCRLENTAHLLLDFSDVTQVNVFELGRTLSFVSRSLHINLPSTDPCLYILRFACMLEFGDKQKEVVSLATRLVQRMKRDWMSTGRRPTGICGAALLIAARSMNFNRTIGDIVKVVHISDSVVRKRLDEFMQTPSGALTIDEFTTVDLEHCEDPPAYREARRRAREDQMKKETDSVARMEQELEHMEDAVERALEERRREKFKKSGYAKLVSGNIEGLGQAGDLVRDEILETVYNVVDEDGASMTSSEHYEKYGPSLESLGIRKSKEKPQDAPQTSTANDDDGNLSDISDSEIDTYILTESESQIKEQLWTKINGETMRIIEQRKKEREEALQSQDPQAKKKPYRGRKSTSDAALGILEKVMQEKKLSNKVNYDILKEIEGTSEDTPKIKMEPEYAPVRRTLASSLVPKRKSLVMEPICSAIGIDQPIKAVTDALDAEEEKKKLSRRRNKRPNLALSGKMSIKTEPNQPVDSMEDAPEEPTKQTVSPIKGKNNRARPLLIKRAEAQKKAAEMANELEQAANEVPKASEVSSTTQKEPEEKKPLIKSRYTKAKPIFKKPSEPESKKPKI